MLRDDRRGLVGRAFEGTLDGMDRRTVPLPVLRGVPAGALIPVRALQGPEHPRHAAQAHPERAEARSILTAALRRRVNSTYTIPSGTGSRR